MKYQVSLSQGDGEFAAECDQFGIVSHGLSANSALDRMREAIRYNIEFCPCSAVSEEYVELEIVQGRL